MFQYLTSGKSRHYVLDKLFCLFEKMVIEEWLNQTNCVWYFTNIHFGSFIILPVHKSDTLCYLSYCIDCEYIHIRKYDLWIHTVLTVLLWFILFLHDFTSEKSRHYVLANLLCWFDVHLVIEQWFNQTYSVSYFTKIHLVCFVIWPLYKSDNMC